MEIELVKHELFGWTVLVDGEVLLECMSDAEVEELTIKEIRTLANRFL